MLTYYTEFLEILALFHFFSWNKVDYVLPTCQHIFAEEYTRSKC